MYVEWQRWHNPVDHLTKLLVPVWPVFFSLCKRHFIEHLKCTAHEGLGTPATHSTPRAQKIQKMGLHACCPQEGQTMPRSHDGVTGGEEKKGYSLRTVAAETRPAQWLLLRGRLCRRRCLRRLQGTGMGRAPAAG